jgi:hypothetical protein
MRKTWRRWSAAARNGATVATDVLVLLVGRAWRTGPVAQLLVSARQQTSADAITDAGTVV